MRRRIAHWGAAFLLGSALLMQYAHPTETQLPPQVKQDAAKCTSPEQVAARMGTLTPAYDFTGAALRAWNANFHAIVGLEPSPNVDRLISYGNFHNDNPQEQALVLAFAGPCLFSAVVVPDPAVQKILVGHGA